MNRLIFRVLERLTPISAATIMLCVGLLGTAYAQPAPACDTPRQAVDSLFVWQLGKEAHLDNAAICLEKAGRSPSQRRRSAAHLKALYDAAGAFVQIDSVSDDPNHLETITPHRALPAARLEKRGERWLWTKTTLDWADATYEKQLGWLDRTVHSLPSPFRSEFGGLALWQYLALMLLGGLGLLVRQLLRTVVASRLKKLSEKFDHKRTASVVDLIASPGATLLTAIILRIGYPQLRLPIGVTSALSTTVRVLITVSIVWAAYRSADLVAARLAEKAEKTESKLDDQLVPLIRKSLKIIVFVMGTLVVLQNLDFDVTALLASVSIGTLAFGLAAKDTLANLFGSLSIFIDSPFQIGDWINAMGVDGSVEEVGFRSTRVRTFYNSIAVLPNAKLADSRIDNYGQREFRRCFVKLGLTYSTTPEQMQAFVEGCRAIVLANKYTRKDSFEVHMCGFGDSALEVMLYFFFKCDTWSEELQQKHNVFLEVMRLAKALGVDFAFPTQSLHLESAATPEPTETLNPPSMSELERTVVAFGPEGKNARPDGPSITQSKQLPQPAPKAS